MSVATDTTKHEIGRGDSRIAPTGGYFQGNDVGASATGYSTSSTLSGETVS